MPKPGSARSPGGTGLFTLEHGVAAYRADFALYAATAVVLLGLLLFGSPHDQWQQNTALAVAGLLGWSAAEYLLHRFILHGMEPFRGWHAAHHARPTALICTPTLFSAALIATLVFLPALWWGGAWQACALTLGVLTGYLAYTVTHHATHHWRADTAWLRRRKRWHALHHQAAHAAVPACYGVTSAFWDHVFRSALPAPGDGPGPPH